jgi:ATP-dependent Clp endopeptidase proteolytic subunit ClpP
MQSSRLTPLVVALSAKSADTLDINIYDVIGAKLYSDGVRAKDVLAQVSASKSAKTINLRINSAGGDVFEGVAIYNTLAAHPARKTVTIDGIAASMASVIAMVGDEIIMPNNSLMMIHDPSAFAGGNAKDLRKTAEVLEKTRANLANIYAARTRQTLAKVLSMMTAETWMTADEAKALGFADRVTDSVKMVAMWDLSACFKTPPAVKSAFEALPPVLLRNLYLPENRWLIANFRNLAAQAIGEPWPEDETEQHAVVGRYLHAVSTGAGIKDELAMRKAERAREEMAKGGVPLMPPPPSAA